MLARSIAILPVTLVLIYAGAARSQDSMECDAKRLCPSGSACVVGGSITGDHTPGEISKIASWHSDVFRKEIPGRIVNEKYCYYRVIRLDDAAALPVFWRPAGLKYLGSKAVNEKGCIFACTESEWDDKKPDKPAQGDIEYQPKGETKSAPSWAPPSGWTATVKGDLAPVPGQTDPGSGSKTLVAQEQGAVRVEFESRVFPGGVVRYSVRNFARPVRVVWNIPKNPAFASVEGPFTRAGIVLKPGDTFERDVAVTQAGDDARITQWQTEASVAVEGARTVMIAVPAVGPSTGRFDTNPVEFWQQTGPL